MDAYDLAVELAEAWDFRVFPCKGKQPLVPRWQDSTSDPDEWLQARWRHATHVGLVMGGGLCAVDDDTNEWRPGVPTWWQKTPKGAHYVFRGDLPTGVGTLGEGIDTRGEGKGYIVTGPGYTRHPEEIAPLPPEVSAQLRRTNREERHAKPSDFVTPDSVPEGKRNSTLFSQACVWRNMGATPDQLHEWLGWANKGICSPPLEADEVAKIAASAAGYTPEREYDGELLRTPLRAFMSREHPPRQVYVEPWLQSGSIVMVWGRGGVGKSLFFGELLLSLAYPGGRFMRWARGEVTRPTVYLLDFEMPEDLIQQRLAMVPADYPLHVSAFGHLPDKAKPSLSDQKFQDRIYDEIMKCGAEITIIDNKQTAFSESDATMEAFESAITFTKRLQANNVGSFTAMHSNKTGQDYSGNSRFHNIADAEIQISRRSWPQKKKFVDLWREYMIERDDNIIQIMFRKSRLGNVGPQVLCRTEIQNDKLRMVYLDDLTKRVNNLE